ncbi:putative Mg2+ transporter-C (MgtC) family protein [Mesobacillus persicus]|uniref:Putative Mg2+ transporter-C (MgtC) family protein n=1 Tax=Mesobacillus persicus TaxID=930146 RepID=A0A1H7ZNA9_9BACI|nr:MgtC/SapB family protein [Mesobacillus persicus]SEM59414.1 putative Mg2+ transporter-C (MgtC) family protein [Mesobacillus persicus]
MIANMIDSETLIRLGISAFLGLVIGLERELKRKPVGLKTSLVISIVSCLLTIVSIESAYMFPGDEDVNITMDPLRLAAQIVSGIGFLGAGVILRRGNDTISGLTTAAMIWGAAGIGIAVGAGFYIEAIAGVALLIFSVEFMPFLMGWIGPRQLREKELALEFQVSNKKGISNVLEKLKNGKMSLKKVRIKDLEEGDQLVQLVITVNFRRRTTDIYEDVSSITEINRVKIEEL